MTTQDLINILSTMKDEVKNGGNKKRGNCTMFQVFTAVYCHVFYYVLCTGTLLTIKAD